MGFTFFNILIPYYGFFIATGIVLACFLGFLLVKRLNLDINDFIIVAAYLVGFGFLGAKLLYIIVSLKTIDLNFVFDSFYNFSIFISSGFVFYGGLIGGFLGLLFVKKIHKIPVKDYIEPLIPCLSLTHAFGRIGCSFAGCCHGKETNCFLYVIYDNNPMAPNGVKLFPVQAIESVFLFLFTLLFIYLILSKKRCKLLYLYVILYSILRFILEFFRGDNIRGSLFSLSTSQIISIVLLFLTLFVLVFKKKNSK